MERHYREAVVKYCSIIQSDAWNNLFQAISRLVTIEEDLGSENVKSLQGLHDLAEDVRKQILGK